MLLGIGRAWARVAGACLLGLFCVAVAGRADAQVYRFEWLVAAGGPGDDWLSGIDVDGDGNISVAGTFTQQLELAGATVSVESGAGRGLFMAKFDPHHDLLWLTTPRGSGHSVLGELAVAPLGAAWVSGNCGGALSFGSEMACGADPYPYGRVAGTFLSLVDAAGSPQLSAIVGSDYDRYRDRALAATPSGEMYVIDGQAVARYAADGRRLGEQAVATSGSVQVRDIAVDGAGNAIVVGTFQGSVTIGGRTLGSPGGRQAQLYVARLTTTGVALVAMRAAAGLDIDAWSIKVQSDGDLIVYGEAGTFYGPEFSGDTEIFGQRVHHEDADRHPFVAQIGPLDGSVRWAQVGLKTHAGPTDFYPGFGFDVDDDYLDRVLDLQRGGMTLQEEGAFGFLSLFSETTLGSATFRTATSPSLDPSILFHAGAGGFRAARSIHGLIVAAHAAGPHSVLVGGAFLDELSIDGLTVRSHGGADAWLGLATLVTPGPDHCPASTECTLPSWQHKHWRCPHVRGGRDLSTDCSDVFEDGFASLRASDTFTTAATLTLSAGTDVDRFRIQIPDPTLASWGAFAWGYGHADIRPASMRTVDPRDPDAGVPTPPEPLKECGLVQRIAAGPARPDNIANVTTLGQLTVKVAAAPVEGVLPELRGEQLHIYQDGVELGDRAEGSATERSIRCPRSRHGLTDLEITFGERDHPRSVFDTVRYKLSIEYRIDAERGWPPWVLRQTNDRAADPLLCTLARGGRGFFPDCLGSISGFEIFHPGVPSIDCIADGPGCFQLYRLDWERANMPINLALSATAPVNVSLFDVTHRVVGTAQSIAGSAKAARMTNELSLRADLEPGVYMLGVSGPRSHLTAALREGTTEREPAAPSRDRRAPIWPWIAFALLVIAAGLMFRLRRS